MYANPMLDYEYFAYATALGLATLSAIYPAVVLWYMTRPRVREAFHGVTRLPPP
jgi:hypothetical protein